jgi:chemotaxis protein CheD
MIYLKPGELRITDRPEIVTTVLGSCVSVTMFSGRLHLAAICHGLLPRWTQRRLSGGGRNEGLKYVDYALRCMVAELESRGAEPREIEVKLFGGADLLSPGGSDAQSLSVGRQNILAAVEVIEQERLTIRKRDVGGMVGRKLHFHSHTGLVLLKRLKAAHE